MKIILETTHLLAVNKPAGWTVEHAAHHSSIEDWAREHVAKQVKNPFIGIVHRLDRPVSGVLLMAKKKIAMKQLNEQFRERKVRKTYLAVVGGEPPAKSDKIQHWLIKDQQHKKTLVAPKPSTKTMEVTLHYRVLEQQNGRSLLEIHPYTGKFHQIRAQLAAIGCPILGDEKYGGPALPRQDVIALHAYRLAFNYPFLDESHLLTAEVPSYYILQRFGL